MQQRRGDELSEAAAQDFRHAELRIIGGVDEIVTVHDAERAAETIAVYLRDDDAREGAQRLGDLDGEARAVPVEQGAVRHLAKEAEIETGGIHGAGALGDDDLELLVGPNDVERLDEGEAERAVPAIALVRPVQNDPRDAGVREPLQDELRPFLQILPSISHSMLHLCTQTDCGHFGHRPSGQSLARAR